ncbi:MAG: DEAD/DEAH box helicase, partial [Sphaerochaeta sp.]|nr:DEAD/DEAH box helicase [Sphaerochaeta sp.]
YYKQQYQNEGGQVSPPQTSQVPRTPVKKAAAAPVAKEQDQAKKPEQKLGFFARLFRRKK